MLAIFRIPDTFHDLFRFENGNFRQWSCDNLDVYLMFRIATKELRTCAKVSKKTKSCQGHVVIAQISRQFTVREIHAHNNLGLNLAVD